MAPASAAASVVRMPRRVLIAYATTHGHTGRIVERIAEVLRAAGLACVLERLDEGAQPDPRGYDGVIVAASVHGGHHQREIVDWARRHQIALSRHPSALLSVSLTAADEGFHARSTTRRLIDDLLDDTGWTPDVRLPVAGALEYERYDFPTRLVMRLVARRHGAPEDVAHDVDFTDWEAIAAFAEQFAATISAAPAAATTEVP